MRVVVPPIKSQGIKTKLVPWIRTLAPPRLGRWIEPFMGTGVVALNMDPQEAVLCDINPHVIRFYKAIQAGDIEPAGVREYLEREGKALEKAPDDGYEHFRAIRNRFNEKYDPLDFLFLSRAGFNGMMRFNRSGKWNVPFCKKPQRFSRSYVTKIVNQVAEAARIIRPGWRLLAESYEKTIPLATRDDVIYCDPPYLGRHVCYYGGWTEGDERRLFGLLSETPARFMLSTWHHNDYRCNPMMDELWGRFNVVTREHFYHAGAKLGNRGAVVEALVFNFEAKLPLASFASHGMIQA
jgi:DNA adenine methylase